MFINLPVAFMHAIRIFLSQWFERLSAIRSIAFARFVAQRFAAFNLPQTAGYLTYTTLLALIPLLAVFLLVIRHLPSFSDWKIRFFEALSGVLLPSGVNSVQTYLQEFTLKAGGLTIIGLVVIAFSALLLMMTVENTFNRIWGVKLNRPLWLRVVVGVVVMILGPVCIGIMSALYGLVIRQSSWFTDNPLLTSVIYNIVSTVFYTLVLTFLYRTIPSRYVPMRHAMIGGLIAALLFVFLRIGFRYYVRHFNNYELIYGAFAAFPLFLLWIFCLWSIVLTGAVLTAGLSHWQGEAFRRLPSGQADVKFSDVVLLLAQLTRHSEGLTVHQLRQNINLGYDVLGHLLEQLRAMGYVHRPKKFFWMLSCSPEEITMGDLYQYFVYSPELDRIHNAISQVFMPSSDVLKMSLTHFLNRYLNGTDFS